MIRFSKQKEFLGLIFIFDLLSIDKRFFNLK